MEVKQGVPCQVPRFRPPFVIGIETDVPTREVLVCDALHTTLKAGNRDRIFEGKSRVIWAFVCVLPLKAFGYNVV
jgi:hypothetical protein